MNQNNNYSTPNMGGQCPNPPQANDVFATDRYGKSRGVCALLAIFLGGFGIQYFYLGKTTAGIIALIGTGYFVAFQVFFGLSKAFLCF